VGGKGEWERWERTAELRVEETSHNADGREVGLVGSGYNRSWDDRLGGNSVTTLPSSVSFNRTRRF